MAIIMGVAYGRQHVPLCDVFQIHYLQTKLGYILKKMEKALLGYYVPCNLNG